MEEKEKIENVEQLFPFNNTYEIINFCRTLLYKGEYNCLLIKEECEWHLDYHIAKILYEENRENFMFASDIAQSTLFGIKIVLIKNTGEPIQLYKKI